ncbi:MAG: hypothetical protein MRQ09_02310 [Candidatus Midichloria sp.]|nr:hypothetical protein [Candidatus Midichloria sp.]
MLSHLHSMTPAAAGSGVSGDIGYPHERREIHNRKRPVVDDKDFGKRNNNPEQNAEPDDLADRQQVDNREQFNDKDCSS